MATLLVPSVLVVALGWYSYDNTLDNAVARGKRNVAVLREHALRVLNAQETVISWIDEKLAGRSWDEIRNSQDIHDFLDRIEQDNEHIDGIALVSPDGLVANSASVFPMPDTNVSNRDYYQVLKEHDESYLGQLIEGKNKDNLSFNLSRRRSTSDGSFDGLILVSTRLGYLEALWREILRTDVHMASIVRADGRVLARYPLLPTMPARIPDNSPFYKLSANSGIGSYSVRTPLDGRNRLISFAKLGRFPAYIVVGLDRETMFAPWRRNMLILGFAAAAAMLLLGTVVEVAQRREDKLAAEVKRRRSAETSLIEKAEHLAAMEQAEEALRDSEERLHAALAASHMGTFRLNLRSGEMELGEPMQRLFGIPGEKPPVKLDGFISLVHPDDRERVEKAFEEGSKKDAKLSVEFRVVRSDGREAWLYIRGRTRSNAAGRPKYLTGAGMDITSRKEAEDRQKLITAELDHRVRNTLASIQSILRLARRSAKTKEEFADAVAGRVQAMARTHSHLTHSGWRGAALRALIADELAPYAADDSKTTIDGPDILLLPSASVSMALVVHELTTNAAKYGALSVPEGSVAISWAISDAGEERTLDFRWSERSGPPVKAPSQGGFGSIMLKRVLEHEFGAVVQADYAMEGFRFEAAFPLDRVVAEEKTDPGMPDPPPPAPPSTAAPAVAGARVLLVEDESVVALHMVDRMEALGVKVVGPFNEMDKATETALGSDIDAALLDVNMNGRTVFPLADILAARGIPFAFVSGYESSANPARFQDRPHVRKPVGGAALSELLAQLLPGVQQDNSASTASEGHAAE